MTEVDNHPAPKEAEDEVEDVSKLTQIQNKYTFWFRGGTASAAKTAVINYQESIRKIGSFQTVEHFWRIYDHLKRPNEFRVTTEYHLFKEGITPTWEDPQNKLGGKWMVRLKKGIASRYWEDVVLAVIGEQFDVGPEICGAVISVRNNEDIISIWNKTADNAEAVNKIRDQLRRIWKLPSIIPIEYKRHQDSLVDKSSYRNPTMVWRAPGKAGGNEGSGGPNNSNNSSGNQNNSNQGGGAGGYNTNQGGAGNRPYNKTQGGDGSRPHYNNYSNNNNSNSNNSNSNQDGIPKAAWKPNRNQDAESGGNNTLPTRGWATKPAAAAASAEEPVKSLDDRKGFTKINISGWQRAKSSDDPTGSSAAAAAGAAAGGVSGGTVSEGHTPTAAAAPAGDVWSRVKTSAAVAATDK